MKMLWLIAIGGFLDVTGAIIITYPRFNTKEMKKKKLIKPYKKNLKKKNNKPYKKQYWTNRKIKIVGLAIFLIGASFDIMGLYS